MVGDGNSLVTPGWILPIILDLQGQVLMSFFFSQPSIPVQYNLDVTSPDILSLDTDPEKGCI